MKLKTLVLFAVLVLMALPVFSQDAGNVDSLKLVTPSTLTSGLPSQPFLVVCSTYVDQGQLSTLQFAFKWDNVDLVLDSVKASAAFEAMDIGPFYYLDDDRNKTNDSNIALCSGTSIFNNFPSNANWQHVATYYFTINNWTTSSRGTITIDTVTHPDYASTQYIFLPLGGSPYEPFWLGPLIVSTSDIGESDPNNIPQTFELGQNYPNPFNPTTSIKFGIPSKSHVSLKVYNLLGQEITTLVDQTVAAGTHTTEWNGKDKSGVDVASGIYFYKLVADNFVETKKMMLVK